MKKYLTIMILVCSTSAFGETISVILEHSAKEALRKSIEQ